MRRVLPAGSLLLSAFMITSSLIAPAGAAAPTLVGKDAPDFVLKGMDGRNLRMSEFRGQVVLVNFWARWASDARQQMPALDRINTTYSRAGLSVVVCVRAKNESRRSGPGAGKMSTEVRPNNARI